MKRHIQSLVLVLVLMVPQMIFAAQSPRIEVRGRLIEAQPAAYIKDGRTYVPLRYVTEALGCTVDWIEEEQTVVIAKLGSPRLWLVVGKTKARLGDKEISLDSPVEIRGDRTFVPLRAIGETLGFQIRWDQETNTVRVD